MSYLREDWGKTTTDFGRIAGVSGVIAGVLAMIAGVYGIIAGVLAAIAGVSVFIVHLLDVIAGVSVFIADPADAHWTIFPQKKETQQHRQVFLKIN
ncbi:hypothetical protein [Robertmurraya massiliosenegalensis]|uniref:hypothetical protein n=1 Tax=Robertmurraya massiliosenegalensis TaxID=1287657 RepID=UPI000380C24B|nr:hypothetical protein [Robertmurraya massiliosenegalensis]